MDRLSAAALARQLGTTSPRVARAIERLGIRARTESGRYLLSRRQAERIRAELGVTPRHQDLSCSELLVLAALRSAPFGLVSKRAVAARSGLSPTAAGRALDSLFRRRLVRREKRVIAAGSAQEVNLWRVRYENPNFSKLDPILDRVEVPKREGPLPKRVPARLRHLFWNTAPSQLGVEKNGPYIARRLLQTMDLQGLAWGSEILCAEDWLAGAQARNLDKRVRVLAANLAREASL